VAHSFLGRDSVASCRRLGRIISHRAEAKGEGANLGVPHPSLSLRRVRAAEGKSGAPEGAILELSWAMLRQRRPNPSPCEAQAIVVSTACLILSD
jgi:hypothetical protein